MNPNCMQQLLRRCRDDKVPRRNHSLTHVALRIRVAFNMEPA